MIDGVLDGRGKKKRVSLISRQQQTCRHGEHTPRTRACLRTNRFELTLSSLKPLKLPTGCCVACWKLSKVVLPQIVRSPMFLSLSSI
jgi:hypothetical protein